MTMLITATTARRRQSTIPLRRCAQNRNVGPSCRIPSMQVCSGGRGRLWTWGSGSPILTAAWRDYAPAIFEQGNRIRDAHLGFGIGFEQLDQIRSGARLTAGDCRQYLLRPASRPNGFSGSCRTPARSSNGIPRPRDRALSLECIAGDLEARETAFDFPELGFQLDLARHQ
jgi:hypothetical protein